MKGYFVVHHLVSVFSHFSCPPSIFYFCLARLPISPFLSPPPFLPLYTLLNLLINPLVHIPAMHVTRGEDTLTFQVVEGGEGAGIKETVSAGGAATLTHRRAKKEVEERGLLIVSTWLEQC